ncbi:MAG: diacylglycerol kinase family protein [Steroidobacteraceae bacterium]
MSSSGSRAAQPAPPERITRDMPLFIVMNARSGALDFEESRRSIAQVFERAGQPHEFLLIHHPKEIVSVVERAAELGKTRNGAVIASGGDGTINALAQRVLPTLRPFGILPKGTFNYFARVHGIPLDLAEAAKVLLEGRITPVQVGAVNDRIFLVNASLGLHPQMLQDREEYTKRYGRRRFIALLAGLRTVFRERNQLNLHIEHDQNVENVRTPSLFISNNSLQLEQVGLPEAEAVERWRLAAILMKPVGSMALLKLALQGALGRLGEADNVRSFELKRMTVAPRSAFRSQRMQVATDGERLSLRAPLQFSLTPQPLMLIKPVESTA